LLATGICGAFTTFSTFAVEVDLRFRSGDVVSGLGYVAASVAAGLAAVAAGIALARSLSQRKAAGWKAERAPGVR
jgi:CrcB protein